MIAYLEDPAWYLATSIQPWCGQQWPQLPEAEKRSAADRLMLAMTEVAEPTPFCFDEPRPFPLLRGNVLDC